MSARLVFYWNNGRSLGHTSRSATIAQAALERVPDAQIFGLTGASRGLELLPPGMAVVKIPSFFSYDLPGGVIVRPSAAIGEPELRHLRTSLINVFIDSFIPDALIVDYYPYGRKHELERVLDSSAAFKILGLRGVLGARAKTNAEFFSTDVVRHIDRTYEKVLIYTDSDLIDLEMLYEIPPVLRRKLHYTGYVARRTPLTRAEARRRIGCDDRLLIVAAFGGAQGALPLYLSLFDAVRRVVPNDATVVVPLGPYLKQEEVDCIYRSAFSDARIRVAPLLHDLPMWMRASDLFIGAAGYNTIAEVLANRPNAILVPRQINRSEQTTHALVMAAKSLARCLPLDAFTSGSLAQMIVVALAEPYPTHTKTWRVDGAAEASAIIEAAL